MSSIAFEENELMNDSKYRLYITSIDKALKSFEYTSEWADLISALGKLNKLLSSHTKYPVIPRRMKISKRLAQCLHPALPSGVHIKALETYDIMFKTMGTNRLSQELFIYSSGLFPVLGHAATNVKGSLLAIYENHFVALGERLGPGLNGFLSGVLPGLEEGTDFCDRTNLLLENVCNCVNPVLFYTCLWECLASNAAVRLPAITFILSHFDKQFSMKDQLFLMGNDVNLMLNGLCTCFQDDVILIQRNALDFLLIGFPMHDSNLSKEHYQMLITCALVTLLRRDMSLNRRLFSWLLGSNVLSNGAPSLPVAANLTENSKHSSDSTAIENIDRYFKTYSKDQLISAIKCVLRKSTNQDPHDLRPYRILISLLDKSDIGPVILDDILFEVFRLLYLCWQTPGNRASNGAELLKSANLLFSSLEPRYLWQYVGMLFSDACRKIPTTCAISNEEDGVKEVNSGDPSLLEVCSVIIFLLDSLSLEIYSETFSEHLPELFLHIISSLTDHCDTIHLHQIAASLKLCLKILSKIRPPVLMLPENSAANDYHDTNYDPFTNSGYKLSEPGKVIQLQTGVDKCDNQNPNTTKASPNKIISSPSRDSKNILSESVIGNRTAPEDDTVGGATVQSEEQLSTMARCLNYYKKFYATFMYVVRLKLGDTKSISNLFKCLLIKSPGAAAEEKAKCLELLLLEILHKSNARSFRRTMTQSTQLMEVYNSCDSIGSDGYYSSLFYSEKTIGLEWKDSVYFASKLLIELSTFQTSVPSNKIFTDSSKITNENSLPDWLKTLIVCSCWLGNVSVPLQLITISTLLDLSMLCRRTEIYTQSSVSTDNTNDSSSSKVVTVVVFVPLLTINQLTFIEYNTNVFQIVIHWLWLHLGDPTYEIKCTELICQLQNILHRADIIENCIGESLALSEIESKRLESFRKFVRLWHISREVMKYTNGSRAEDSFYKCVLKILDNLPLKDSNCLKIEAENWLFHSLLRGDCPRIIDPLLLILLDRSTARVSVSHAKVQQYSQCDLQVVAAAADVPDSKFTIFAVCSVSGKVLTYHLVRNSTGAMNVDFSISRVSENSRGDEQSNGDSLKIVTKEEDKTTQNVFYHEYVKKLPYLENISVFLDRGMSTDETSNASQTITSDFDYVEDREKSITSFDCDDEKYEDYGSKYNTLPLVRDKYEKNEKKIGSCASLENFHRSNDASTNDLSALPSTNSVGAINCNAVDVKKKFRTFVSDDGLATAKDKLLDMKNMEMVRSLSFSGRNNNNSGVDFKDGKFAFLPGGSNEVNFNAAKSVIDAILKDIFENVINSKKNEIIPETEKEEEDDSAISGCSSVTLEYEKEESLQCESLDRATKKIIEGKKTFERSSSTPVAIQFYSHILLFCDLYDTNRVLYTLHKFRDILSVNAKAFLFVVSTTVISAEAPLVQILMKHRNSIFARGFQCSDENPAEMFHKNTTYLEILVTVCLYNIRSFYPNSGNPDLTEKEILGNRQVQIASIELLSQIFFQMCSIVQTNKTETGSRLRELFNRCKVQKIVLHCTWCCLYDDRTQNLHIFIREILSFNKGNGGSGPENNTLEYNQAFQIQFLRLLLSLIVLENELYQHEDNVVDMLDKNEDYSVKCDYLCDKKIIQQPLFLHLLKKMLEPSECKRPMHERVISFIIACLPYLKKSLATVVAIVIRQLCSNIEVSSSLYIKTTTDYYETKQTVPFNYMVVLLDALTILCHYCLIESSPKTTLKSATNAGSLRTFSGLFHMYSDFPHSSNYCHRHRGDCTEAKETVLDNLPKIFAAVSTFWQTIISCKRSEFENVAGSSSVVKNQILNLLNPISVHYNVQFFVSVAVVWKEKMSFVDTIFQKTNVVPEATNDQSNLVHLISSLTSVTPDLLISTVHRVIKQHVAFNQETSAEIEISILEVLVRYIRLITIPRLTECWNTLLLLLREAPNVSTRSQFILCAAVDHFVNRLPSAPDRLMDKKDFKDLQDTIIKLIDICTQTAGTGLEQTTWLRRNLAVRDSDASSNTISVLTPSILFSSEKQSNVTPQHSVAAQLVLAEILIPLVDLVYTNQDKEKLVTLLINVMYNITPYLRNHTPKNANNFHACSQLLACIAGYVYTRKAWKKDAMELLLDPCLFQMEIRSLIHWKTIVNNLMCQDISTFRDLLGRVSLNQNNTLSIFSSKEQEYEQRSQLLKRLAFVILCCDQDQFHKHMPDIQERLTDSLKLPQSTPGIQAQVFLCFRVLLLRMAPHHITSLWPVMITEIIQVMLQVELELATDAEETRQLQLAAAKLLKLAVQLPANRLPQFQMYRWAFVGQSNKQPNALNATQSPTKNHCLTLSNNISSVDFVPHVIRIASLMRTKFGEAAELPWENILPPTYAVRSLQDLHAFFTKLSKSSVPEVHSTAELEREIELDFLEQLPYSSLSSVQSK